MGYITAGQARRGRDEGGGNTHTRHEHGQGTRSNQSLRYDFLHQVVNNQKKREGTGSPAPVTYFFFFFFFLFITIILFFFFFSCATRTARNSTHVGPRKMEQPERARLSGLVVTATTVFSTSQYFNCNSFLSLTRGQISIQLRNNKVSIYLCHLYELDFEANSCGRQTSPRKGS